MKSFFSALQFLTRIPVPASWAGDERDLARSVSWFPVVGLLIGTGIAALDYGIRHLLPPLAVSVLTVIALLAASGCLHIDGLADTADGFLSSRHRERILEIMKDSRTGAMGVVAVVCVIALKIALLSAVVGPLRWSTILLMPLAGRCALVTVMSVLLYARPEGGLGSVFGRNRSLLRPGWALAILMAAGWLAMGWVGMAAGATSFVASLAFMAYAHGKIGGQTGDVLGAACEITELIPPLVTAIVLHTGMQICCPILRLWS